MRAESVRSLKDELRSLHRPPSAYAENLGWPGTRKFAAELGALHVSAPADVSYGLARRGRGGSDFILGARIHATGPRAAALALTIQRRVKNEVDIRFVPHVQKGGPARTFAAIASIPNTYAAAYYQKHHRPLFAGLSCGHVNITAGTLGCFVNDDETVYILSNNHVLADVNAAQPGDAVLQPGPTDLKTTASKAWVGVVDRFVPISFRRSNLVDCAIAELRPEMEYYPDDNDALGGPVKGHYTVIDEDLLGMPVVKVGRTTGATGGIITQVEIDGLRVDMGSGVATFSEQLEVTGHGGASFSLGGDSGSLIVARDGYAVGLLFAGGPDASGVDLTYANPIDTVLKRLGVWL